MRSKVNLYLPLLISITAILLILYSIGIFDSTSVSQETEGHSDDEILEIVTNMKNNVKIGSSKKEVIALFGDNYIQVDDNGDLENGLDEHWLYRFFKDENYHPSVPDHVIDEEGLRSRRIGAQLFIGWKNEQVYLYTIGYVQGTNNDLYFYSNNNGTAQEEIIKPDGTIQIIRKNTDN